MFRQSNTAFRVGNFTFYFLSCIPSVSSKAWFQRFHDVQIIRNKALVYVWIRLDFFFLYLTYFGQKNRNDCEVLKWCRNSWRESHAWIPNYSNCFFLKCNFEPEYLLFVKYLIWLIIIDLMTSQLHS